MGREISELIKTIQLRLFYTSHNTQVLVVVITAANNIPMLLILLLIDQCARLS